MKNSEDNDDPIYRDYVPCPLCAEKSEKGITLIQVTSESNGNPEIRDGLYPTGKWVVATEENVERVLTDLPILDTVLRVRQMFINLEDWEKMKLP